ncbi:MAG: hypothetical protein KF845_11105 [Cyclobacteriaceae bacterium]|nr:hypothetical protein [Cyclobacteriaceae bacterium]
MPIFTGSLASIPVTNQLTSVLSRYTSTSAEEAKQIYALVSAYPYSQALQALAARVSQDHKHNDQKLLLQRAAVYATDRTTLKYLMTLPATVIAESIVEPSGSIATELKHAEPEVLTGNVNEDYADKVIHDLERLQELKHNFEAYFDDSGVALPEIKKEDNLERTEPSVQEEKEAKPAKKKLSKKERIIQLAQELNKVPPSPEEPAWAEKPLKKSKGKNTELEPLVDEIKSTRKKVQPESEKTREQIELIEQFIKSNPLITPPKTGSSEKADLASSLKSGEFGDHIVSETLAEILVRQGKKDKAIEVYKKLIWKFPQKKTYFATQIEELRK